MRPDKANYLPIADDSGIAVDALNGSPGIYSARYAGENADDKANLEKLIGEIRNIPEPNRSAAFVCVLVFVRQYDDPLPVIAQGIWKGKLVTQPKGSNGFGYDPIFYLDEYDCTSAELPPDIKNAISHRAVALQKLLAKLTEMEVFKK